jgi:3-oxoacyl-[acyl-carrier-protein] synthase II
VITGVGVLASNAIGKEDFWKAVSNGISGIKPVSLFDTTNLRSKSAGEIKDFNPEAILGQKGLRNMDRSTKLALAASKLALDDAGLENPIAEEKTDEFGVSLGSTMGSVWSISEFDKEALNEGPRSVNPALFPNTVINSPASQISIKFNIQGFNSTLSTGFCASLDAIYYAMNMISLYDYKVVLSGGVEELCEQTYKGFYKIGHLAGSRVGKEEINCPFDKRRNGIIFGEGAAIFILEELEHARSRSAKIYAELLGYGTSFDPESRNIYNPMAKGAIRAMKECLKDAKLDAADIGYVSAAANSTLDCDAMEVLTIKKVFGSDVDKKIPTSSIKSMVGETYSAAGAMNLASGLGVLEKGVIPPTINYKESDRRCELDCVPNQAREEKVDNVLIDSFSPTGSNSILAIGKLK